MPVCSSAHWVRTYSRVERPVAAIAPRTCGSLSRIFTCSAMDFSPLPSIRPAMPGFFAATLARLTVASRYCRYLGIVRVVAPMALRSASDWASTAVPPRESARAVTV